MFSFLKKTKTQAQSSAAKPSQADDQFVELKGQNTEKQAAAAAKKKSTGCCGSCGGQ